MTPLEPNQLISRVAELDLTKAAGAALLLALLLAMILRELLRQNPATAQAQAPLLTAIVMPLVLGFLIVAASLGVRLF